MCSKLITLMKGFELLQMLTTISAVLKLDQMNIFRKVWGSFAYTEKKIGVETIFTQKLLVNFTIFERNGK